MTEKPDSDEILRLKARIKMFQLRHQLHRAVWRRRFGWCLKACGDSLQAKGAGLKKQLKKIVDDCEKIINKLTLLADSEVEARCVLALLHAIRGYALYAANEKDPRVRVAFRKAQATIRRSASPNERLTSAIILIMEAECYLLPFFDRLRLGKEKAPAGKNPATAVGELNLADGLLRRAEKLLRGARWQNRYHVQCHMLIASLEYLQYNLCAEQKRKRHLRAALRSNIAALTSMGFHTDWMIYARAMYFKIIEPALKNIFGGDGGSLTEHKRCGISWGNKPPTT
jgi:hypothetical protein